MYWEYFTAEEAKRVFELSKETDLKKNNSNRDYFLLRSFETHHHLCIFLLFQTSYHHYQYMFFLTKKASYLVLSLL